MPDPTQAIGTQLANIEKRTGKSLQQLAEVVRTSGLARHGEMVAMLKRDLGMGHGDANTLVHHVRGSNAPGTAAEGGPPLDDVVANLYTGPKAVLQPIHDKLMAAITKFGTFEIAPKKSYVSLRRRKQFAMIGPATNTRVELGLNMKGVAAGGKLTAMPPGGMCSHVVRLTAASEVDAEVIAWIRIAFDAAA